MSWGRVVIMLQAHAREYEKSREPKKGTDAQMFAWVGGGGPSGKRRG